MWWVGGGRVLTTLNVAKKGITKKNNIFISSLLSPVLTSKQTSICNGSKRLDDISMPKRNHLAQFSVYHHSVPPGRPVAMATCQPDCTRVTSITIQLYIGRFVQTLPHPPPSVVCLTPAHPTPSHHPSPSGC